MGLLSDFFSPVVDTLFPGISQAAEIPGVSQAVGALVGGSLGGPAGVGVGASVGNYAAQTFFGEEQPVPDYGSTGGVTTGAPVMQVGMFGSVVGMAGRLSPIVASAIAKISQRMGGASGSIVGYGTRVWSSLSSWAAKNPGVSLVATLVSLGLTAEEAAHFIAWGATKKRRRRRGGISGRDLKTTRSTMRKVINMSHDLRQLCGPSGLAPRRHRRAR